MDEVPAKHSKPFLSCFPKKYGETEPDYKRCAWGVSDSLWSSKQCAESNGYGPHRAYCKRHDPYAVKKPIQFRQTFSEEDLTVAYYLGTLAKFDRSGSPTRWIAERDKALKDMLGASPVVRAGSKVQHAKSGGIYRIVGRAQLQASIPLKDYASMIVYYSEDSGYYWVRPVEEFEDGRFVKLDEGPKQGNVEFNRKGA